MSNKEYKEWLKGLTKDQLLFEYRDTSNKIKELLNADPYMTSIFTVGEIYSLTNKNKIVLSALMFDKYK